MWIPNSLETKCLSHLDEATNWRMLGMPRPAETVRLGWRPFVPIFLSNLLLGTLLLLGVAVAMFASAGMGWTEVRGEAPAWAAVILGIAAAFAGATAHLYRRTWNRRANELTRPAT